MAEGAALKAAPDEVYVRRSYRRTLLLSLVFNLICGHFFFRENSALTVLVILAVSTLYRVATFARLEVFARGCFGLYPGQYRLETRLQTTRNRLRSATFIACTAAAAIFS